MAISLKDLEMEIAQTFLQEKDQFDGFMTDREKNLIFRIQQNQISGDDFYYKRYGKKKTRSKFKFLKPKERPAVEFPVGTLGKLPKFSVRNPKVVMDVPNFDLERSFGMKQTIEELFDLRYGKNSESELFEKIPLNKFAEFIAFSKGKRILGRVLPLLTSEHQFSVLESLILQFEKTDLMKGKEIDLFINHVLTFLFGIELNDEQVFSLFSIWTQKASFLLLLLNKAGLLLTCFLFSRLGEQQVSNQISQIYAEIEANMDHLQSDDTEYEGYFWQFATLLAARSTLEQKKILILELRSKILSQVRSSEEEIVDGVCGFLQSLGIDPSQLEN